MVSIIVPIATRWRSLMECIMLKQIDMKIESIKFKAKRLDGKDGFADISTKRMVIHTSLRIVRKKAS